MVLWPLKAGGADRFLQLSLIDYPWDAELFTELCTGERMWPRFNFSPAAAARRWRWRSSHPSVAFSPPRRELRVERKSGALIRADESLERRNQQGPDAACVGFMRFIYVVSTWKRAHKGGSERGPVRFLYRQSAELLTRRDAAVPEAGESLWW